MNVIFHTTTAIGVAVLLTNTRTVGTTPAIKEVMPTALSAFGVGIISHGILDFIPHCYPINSKLDVIAGLAIILLTTWICNPQYRAVVGFSFFGCIFPDLFDLGPKILNKQLSLGLTIYENVFPWHWYNYSGSIYSGDCVVSTVNHFLLIFTLAIIFWTRRRQLKNIFAKNRHHDITDCPTQPKSQFRGKELS